MEDSCIQSHVCKWQKNSTERKTVVYAKDRIPIWILTRFTSKNCNLNILRMFFANAFHNIQEYPVMTFCVGLRIKNNEELAHKQKLIWTLNKRYSSNF